MTGIIDSLSVQQQLELIYIGYFNRSADGGGYSFWESQNAQAQAGGQSADVALTNIANSFAPQPETNTLYPGLAALGAGAPGVAAVTSFVQQVYMNLFDRAVATSDAGLQYWVTQIDSGAVGFGKAILAIANGATGADAIELENKVDVALDFTTRTTAAGIGTGSVLPSSFLTAARGVLSEVDGVARDDASVSAGFAATTAYITPAITLTTGVDSGATFSVTTDNAVFNAPAGQNPTTLLPANTLNTGDDLVDTGASGQLNATFVAPAAGIVATINGVAVYDLTNTSGGVVTLNAANLTHVATINDVGSTGEIDIGGAGIGALAMGATTVGLSNLGAGVKLAISETASTLAGAADSLAINATDVGVAGVAGAAQLTIGSGTANGVENWSVNSSNTNGLGNFLALGTLSGTSAASLNVTGSGAIELSSADAVSNFEHVTTINASAATGNVTITGHFSAGSGADGLLDGNTVLTSAIFGSGNDSIDLSSFASVAQFTALTANGGAGVNTMIVDNAELSGASVGAFAHVTNFQVIGDPDAGGTIDWSVLPAGADTLALLGTTTEGPSLTINNAPASFTLNQGVADAVTTTTINAAGSGVSDTFTDVIGTATATTSFAESGTHVIQGYENIDVDSIGPSGPLVNDIFGFSDTASPGGAVEMDISGAQALSFSSGGSVNGLQLNGNGASIVDTDTSTLSINATNAVDIDAHASGGLLLATADTGFSGLVGDVITGSQTAANLLAGSVANDVITSGTGGDQIITEGGGDTINLSATANSDIIDLYSGSATGVSSAHSVVSGPYVAVAGSIADGSDLAQAGYWGVAPGGAPLNIHALAAGFGTSADMSVVNQFTSGSATSADVIDFSVSAWKFGGVSNGLEVGSLGSAANTPAVGSDASIGQQSAGTTVAATVSLVEFTGQQFANAAALASGLEGADHLIFSGNPGSASFDSHVLVAYNDTAGNTRIADVALSGTNADTAHDVVRASDMVELVGVSDVTSLVGHNAHFVA
jgi:hypothetical protein